MKKSMLIVSVLMLMLSVPVMAEETPAQICAAEAADAGYENQDEINAYVAECVANMEEETNQASTQASNG